MHIPIGINNELHNVFTFQSTNNFLKIVHSYFEFLQNINMYGVLCTKVVNHVKILVQCARV